jgi:uncharacterized protein (TIRG00374 family)
MPEPAKKIRKSLVVNAVLVFLAFFLLAYVIWRERDKISEVFQRKLDLRLLGLAMAIYLVGLLLTFVRWFLLVRAIEPHFQFRKTLVLGFIGNVFNLVIPGAVGGDLIKAAYLVRMHIKKTQAIASMVIDRIEGLMGLFLLATAAGIFAWSQSDPQVRTLIVFAWLITAFSFLLLVVIFARLVSRLFPGLKGGHTPISVLMAELNEMSATYSKRPGLVAGTLLLSTFIHTLNVIAFFLVGKMLFGPQISTTLAQHFLMVPLTLFTMVVPIPFGALGLSEGISDQLFKLVDHPSGALAMMGFRILMYGSGLIGACVYLANLKEVRSLSQAADHLDDDEVEG